MEYEWIPAKFRKKMYVCDRKKCDNCPSVCTHTLDISHAVEPDRNDFYLQGEYWIQTMIKKETDDE